jgi:hypothetical protein
VSVDLLRATRGRADLVQDAVDDARGWLPPVEDHRSGSPHLLLEHQSAPNDLVSLGFVAVGIQPNGTNDRWTCPDHPGERIGDISALQSKCTHLMLTVPRALVSSAGARRTGPSH